MKAIEIVGDLIDEREHLVLSRLNHENIVKYYLDFEETFSSLKYLCIITEYCKVMSIFFHSILIEIQENSL